jgi:predicted transcriptional regulator
MATTATTTIRIPRSLHRQLSEYAKPRRLTLVGAIERSLEAALQEEFWAAVDASMGTTEAVAESQAEAASVSGTLRDGLDDESAYWIEALR